MRKKVHFRRDVEDKYIFKNTFIQALDCFFSAKKGKNNFENLKQICRNSNSKFADQKGLELIVYVEKNI